MSNPQSTQPTLGDATRLLDISPELLENLAADVASSAAAAADVGVVDPKFDIDPTLADDIDEKQWEDYTAAATDFYPPSAYDHDHGEHQDNGHDDDHGHGHETSLHSLQQAHTQATASGSGSGSGVGVGIGVGVGVGLGSGSGLGGIGDLGGGVSGSHPSNLSAGIGASAASTANSASATDPALLTAADGNDGLPSSSNAGGLETNDMSPGGGGSGSGGPKRKRPRGAGAAGPGSTPSSVPRKRPNMTQDPNDPNAHLLLPTNLQGRTIDYSSAPSTDTRIGPVFIHPPQGTIQACVRCHGIKRKCEALEWRIRGADELGINGEQGGGGAIWERPRCSGCEKADVPCVFELAAASSGFVHSLRSEAAVLSAELTAARQRINELEISLAVSQT